MPLPDARVVRRGYNPLVFDGIDPSRGRRPAFTHTPCFNQIPTVSPYLSNDITYNIREGAQAFDIYRLNPYKTASGLQNSSSHYIDKSLAENNIYSRMCKDVQNPSTVSNYMKQKGGATQIMDHHQIDENYKPKVNLYKKNININATIKTPFTNQFDDDQINERNALQKKADAYTSLYRKDPRKQPAYNNSTCNDQACSELYQSDYMIQNTTNPNARIRSETTNKFENSDYHVYDETAPIRAGASSQLKDSRFYNNNHHPEMIEPEYNVESDRYVHTHPNAKMKNPNLSTLNHTQDVYEYDDYYQTNTNPHYSSHVNMREQHHAPIIHENYETHDPQNYTSTNIQHNIRSNTNNNTFINEYNDEHTKLKNQTNSYHKLINRSSISQKEDFSQQDIENDERMLDCAKTNKRIPMAMNNLQKDVSECELDTMITFPQLTRSVSVYDRIPSLQLLYGQQNLVNSFSTDGISTPNTYNIYKKCGNKQRQTQQPASMITDNIYVEGDEEMRNQLGDKLANKETSYIQNNLPFTNTNEVNISTYERGLGHTATQNTGRRNKTNLQSLMK